MRVTRRASGRAAFAALAALAVLVLPFAAGSLSAQSELEIAVPRTETRPIIDGRLDEPLWQRAAVLDQWVQTEPADNGRPHGPTTAYLVYDREYLFIAIRAKDEPGAIRYRMHERDAVVMQSQDWIGVGLDPTNARRRAFFFVVNPIGVQGDGVNIEGGGFEDWNGIFQTAGQAASDEYTVELAIPFKSLRYPRQRDQRWGLTISRHYGRDGAVDYPWSRNRDLACDLCQMITMTGISDITSTAGLELNPAVVGHLAADRPTAVDRLGPARTRSEFGANLKYGITSSLTLDGTWNPDFSQVEADAGQLEINNRFALFFPEKRPFFLEGADIFQTRFGMPGQDGGFQPPPVNLFHSRRIVDPDAGLKLTGKTGRVSLGVLAAIDAAREYQLAESVAGLEPDRLDPFAGGETRIGVARVRVDVLADGYLGASLTTRRFGNGQGTVASFDGRARLGGNTTVRMLAARSQTDEPDVLGPLMSALGERLADPLLLAAALDSIPPEARALDRERRTGTALQASIDYDNRHWNIGLGVLDITPAFETSLGFTPRTDFALLTGFGSYTWQSTGFFRRIKPQVRFEEGYQHGPTGRIGDLGPRTDRLVSSFLDFQLPAATGFSVGYTTAFLRVEGIPFRGLDRGFVWLSSSAFRGFDFSLFARGGEEAIFTDVVDAGPPLPSSFLSVSVSGNVRPVAPVRIGLDLTAARVWRRESAPANRSRYAESAIPRLKAQVQWSKRLGLRLIGEYRFERFFHRSGALAEKRDVLSTDVLATYLVYPGQSIQVGWSTLAAGELGAPFQTVARGGVAKVTYLWRF
jgi:hypothetical protein